MILFHLQREKRKFAHRAVCKFAVAQGAAAIESVEPRRDMLAEGRSGVFLAFGPAFSHKMKRAHVLQLRQLS